MKPLVLRRMPEMLDPRFVAPELVSGSDPSVLSDIYALGMLLYELVTLHPPFPDAPAPEPALSPEEETATEDHLSE